MRCRPHVVNRIGTWNVEGVGEKYPGKIEQIIQHMVLHDVDLMCLQETYVVGAPWHVTEEGYLIILSGGDGAVERAGVGFIVAPRLRHAVVCFKQVSARLASLRLRVRGGNIAVISAYAPHGGYKFKARHDFFGQLSKCMIACKTNGPTLVFGDLNSRLHLSRVGEADIIGPFAFGNAAAQVDATSNRELLVEFCASNAYCVANTFVDRPPEQRVTYRGLGVEPMATVDWRRFAQLDHVLLPQAWQSILSDAFSVREAALNTHHFMLVTEVSISIPSEGLKINRKAKLDVKALGDKSIATAFATSFANKFSVLSARPDDEDEGPYNATRVAHRFAQALHEAADEELPRQQAVAKRPWISGETLLLIDQRNASRRAGAWEEETRLNKEIRAATRRDRETWLNGMVASGDWQSVRKLRVGVAAKHGRMQNLNGELVDSSERAETLADFYEKVQWRVCPPTALPERPPLGAELPIDTGSVKADEVRRVLLRLRCGRASGPDDICPDLWHALTANDAAVDCVVELCDFCWREKDLPSDWHRARVVAIFKKGRVELPDNYRPISLLNVGYKILAAIILDRIKAGGAEDRMWASQYGFRPGHGTAEALFLARRMIDAAWSLKDGKLLMVLLDWRKAFDRIAPQPMIQALRRFGLPGPILQMIEAIYTDRIFTVMEAGIESTCHAQQCGISQGCPLSPYLFIIVMTVVCHDANQRVMEKFGDSATAPFVVTRDVLYADDTLLAENNADILQFHLDTIVELGSAYGLELHWGKTLVLRVRHDGRIVGAQGQGTIGPQLWPLQEVDEAVYLGGLLSADGSPRHELTRRIGEAEACFQKLARIWRHANITKRRKQEIYEACVLSKLLYGLETTWLRKPERSRLNAFHIKCLRRIYGILPSYISRVTNATVLEEAGSLHLSTTLAKRQLLLFGKLARQPADSLPRRLVLKPDSIQSQGWTGMRRRGRPRQQWGPSVRQLAVTAAGGEQQLHDVLLRTADATRWRDVVTAFCETRELDENI